MSLIYSRVQYHTHLTHEYSTVQYSTVLYESHGMYMYITFLVFGSEISTAQYSTVRRIPIIQWNGGEEREQQHVSVVLYCIALYVHDQHQVTAVLTFDHNCNN